MGWQGSVQDPRLRLSDGWRIRISGLSGSAIKTFVDKRQDAGVTVLRSLSGFKLADIDVVLIARYRSDTGDSGIGSRAIYDQNFEVGERLPKHQGRDLHVQGVAFIPVIQIEKMRRLREKIADGGVGLEDSPESVHEAREIGPAMRRSHEDDTACTFRDGKPLRIVVSPGVAQNLFHQKSAQTVSDKDQGL